MGWCATDEQESNLLRDAGFEKIRAKRLYSMSLKEYLETVEKEIVKARGDDAAKEIELVETYLKVVEEEKSVVSRRSLIGDQFECH